MITLAEQKQFSQVISNDDDYIIDMMIDAAYQWIDNYCQWEVLDEYDARPDVIDLAAMNLIHHWWINRGVAIIGKISTDIPYGLESMLQPYVRYTI